MIVLYLAAVVLLALAGLVLLLHRWGKARERDTYLGQVLESARVSISTDDRALIEARAALQVLKGWES